ncbi:MAG: hypothetical protein HZY74_09035 [Brevundimonas sp.]|nr:MAG: hypothetical protein HZY74_09035 [Brevundimonas sp.]
MQLFLDLIRRLLMAILTVLLAQLGMSIEAEMPRQGREVQRTPEWQWHCPSLLPRKSRAAEHPEPVHPERAPGPHICWQGGSVRTDDALRVLQGFDRRRGPSPGGQLFP